MLLLTLEEVRYAYGGREALAGVSLQVAAGEVVALVGPNGAGKSTLLRVAAGLLTPSTGRVMLEGEDLRKVPRRLLARRVGGVSATEEAQFPFTVRESVALGRHPWRSTFGPMSADDARRVEDALAATGLTALADRPVPALSTGERQRVAVARCLAQDARLWLLDEPTAHLDLGHHQRVLALLRQAATDAGKGILAALHDLNAASSVADRVVLLCRGEVLAEGAPRDVLTPARVAEAFEAQGDVLTHPVSGASFLAPR
jgi:iron complex transport system ATP-binding protein